MFWLIKTVVVEGDHVEICILWPAFLLFDLGGKVFYRHVSKGMRIAFAHMCVCVCVCVFCNGDTKLVCKSVLGSLNLHVLFGK